MMDMTFQDILDDFRNELNCPGILMGVEARATDWYGKTGCFSAEDLDKPFYIYSITKTYTATCVLRLVEDGLLDLDDPLIRHMPSLAMPEEVTIRRLLNHRSGIPDYFSIPEYEEALLNDPLKPLSRNVLIEKAEAKCLHFTPGKSFLYSNTGYIYLYKLIEILAGCSYADAIQRFIAEPLNLSMTRVATNIDKELALLPGFASESPFDGKDMRQLYHPDWVATGLVISTIGEVIRFYKKLFKGELLSQESLSEMTTSVRLPNISCPPFVSPGYALGLNHDPDYPLGETYGHGGGGPGYGIYAGYMPNLKGKPAIFCAMCNSSLKEPPWHLWSRVMERIANG
jgi:D-alanyl-D-alanine carboxypeptidase